MQWLAKILCRSFKAPFLESTCEVLRFDLRRLRAFCQRCNQRGFLFACKQRLTVEHPIIRLRRLLKIHRTYSHTIVCVKEVKDDSEGVIAVQESKMKQVDRYNVGPAKICQKVEIHSIERRSAALSRNVDTPSDGGCTVYQAKYLY